MFLPTQEWTSEKFSTNTVVSVQDVENTLVAKIHLDEIFQGVL